MKEKAPKDFARTLRKNQTDAEQLLWRHLRSRRFQDIKFRRQQPIGRYIADFCSYNHKLIIELDGSQHAQETAKDADRTDFLKSQGFRVIRIWDNEVFSNIEGVLEFIY